MSQYTKQERKREGGRGRGRERKERKKGEHTATEEQRGGESGQRKIDMKTGNHVNSCT